MVRFHTLIFLVLAGATSAQAHPAPEKLPLVEVTLRKAREVEGIQWPAGTSLYFSGETKAFVGGRVGPLAAPWRVGGVTWPVGTRIEVDARGEVNSAGRDLAAAEVVGGVAWPAGTRLDFEASGRIARADRVLVAGETLGGYAFPAGAELVLDSQGKLRSARVHCDDEVFAGVRWKSATLVMLSEEGKITALRTLPANETIAKVPWPAGSLLDLDNRGEVASGIVYVKQRLKFAGVWWPEHATLRVTAQGKVTQASISSLPGPTVIEGKVYDEHMWIGLDPATGKVTGAEDPRAAE